MQKPIAEGKNVEKRGKKGKIWIKLATIQSRIRQNENALSRGEKNARKTRQKRGKKAQEKKKKGVIY